MEKQDFCVKIAGAAGEGIMTTGLLLSKTVGRHGWYVFDYPEYPSLIRGGHNTYQIVAGKNPVYCQSTKSDVFVALNKDGLDLHQGELTEGSILLYDKENDKIDISNYKFGAKAIDLPMVKLAEGVGGKDVMGNNVALGACIYILGLDLAVLDQVIADVFADKSGEVIQLNQKAAKAGYDFAQKLGVQPLLGVGPLKKQENRLLTMTGNEAIALGALAGGLQFYAAYPMTPSSSILHFLADKASKAKIVVKHAEDEISVVNMALGASFAGARAMTGTSGGGFCYMVEALGLAGIADLPLVIVESMRPSPALGMPTWTEQGDLNFVINASHGEFARVVLAPGDAQEAFELSRKAMELSQKYRVPVIILSDKYLSESRYCFNLETKVFTNNLSNVIQPLITNSYEHDDRGFSSEESETRTSQVKKRLAKLNTLQQEIPPQFYKEEPNSKLTIISFGSTKGSILQVQKELKSKGIPISMLNLSWIWPFPIEQVNQVISKSKNVVVVEGNSQGQLAQLIASQTGFICKNKLNRFDGRPFYAEETIEYVKGLKI
ncbi:MAG: hypothetical protein A2Y57_01835 [Candidatus Woykebacteria bacterium RBG_13_40_7b]|uniref:2-oxoacid:ferredoxin oxidoreductase subunit alpha n=1 Tax=Candidatus Woykebacteria bacterium RBG_13_40_7b TaxID=1802594 RepID=A0A1G1WB60_9BACT|nr:MAG: hypothetical protein A2Y57_01835 [Candidatus Woykebacteria bacterium RBG_13_40_7b]